MAEKGWRSPGEVWRAYEEARGTITLDDVAAYEPGDREMFARLDAEARAKLERMADETVDRWPTDVRSVPTGGYRGECRVEHQARTERYIVPGGGLV